MLIALSIQLSNLCNAFKLKIIERKNFCRYFFCMKSRIVTNEKLKGELRREKKMLPGEFNAVNLHRTRYCSLIHKSKRRGNENLI